MTRVRTRRTVEELRAASLHLLYERAMLLRTSEQMWQLGDVEPERDMERDLQRMVLLESFLVDARVLLHCFYPEGELTTTMCWPRTSSMIRPSGNGCGQHSRLSSMESVAR